MRIVYTVAAIMGVVWSGIVLAIMGARGVEWYSLSWYLAGGIAGMTAGKFTVWSRIRTDGEERFWPGLATFYVGMVTFWGSWVIVERSAICIRHGGWSDSNLQDHLGLIIWFVVYGTLVWGVLLIPLTFATRWVVWRVYLRYADY
ncbi:MAG: hypothetical protein IPH75_05195 [bacterium]|nr:hypothetical protein [bacterium]